MRRISIKLAEASDQLPSTLFYTGVVLTASHSLGVAPLSTFIEGSTRSRNCWLP